MQKFLYKFINLFMLTCFDAVFNMKVFLNRFLSIEFPKKSKRGTGKEPNWEQASVQCSLAVNCFSSMFPMARDDS